MTQDTSPAAATESAPDEARSRRYLLKGAAVGLGAAGLAVTTGVKPAFAAHQPEDVGIALTNTNSTTTSTVLNTTGAATGAQVLIQSGADFTPGQSAYNAALAVWASGSGTATDCIYAFNQKAGGAGLNVAIPNGPSLKLYSGYFTTAPTTGSFSQGDIVPAADGIWQCVVAGTPGTWRKLAGPASAGAFHAITPHRVYDSRHSSKIPSGGTRTISVANGINAAGSSDADNLVPAGATAIAVNVTITGTSGAGYLTLFPGGATKPTASTINWFASGQTLANGVQLAVSATRTVSIFGGGAGTTHVLLDVSGYYL